MKFVQSDFRGFYAFPTFPFGKRWEKGKPRSSLDGISVGWILVGNEKGKPWKKGNKREKEAVGMKWDGKSSLWIPGLATLFIAEFKSILRSCA